MPGDGNAAVVESDKNRLDGGDNLAARFRKVVVEGLGSEHFAVDRLDFVVGEAREGVERGIRFKAGLLRRGLAAHGFL